MTLDWKSIKTPILALSPMADMTDSAFCQTVRDVVSEKVNDSRLIVFREMVSSEAVVRGNDKTLEMTAIHEAERPLVQQIFGADPKTMAESARIIDTQFKPEGIDINMGCPVYKITSNFNGAALMKDTPLATEIVREMKKVISVPLSVKIRAGWSSHDECVEFAKALEAAGADLITVHGRTKEQGYSGLSNREAVKRVKEAVSIPVLYNGDVFTAEDYFTALEQTGCDGVLIARGGLGNPWIFSQIEEILAGKQPTPVTLADRVRVSTKHLERHVEQYGEKGVATFRKHLSWYFKGIPHMKKYKMALMSAKTQAEVNSILQQILAEEKELDQTVFNA